MEIQIKQGVPKHNFFIVAVPKMTFPEPLVPGSTIVKLNNPKTNEESKAIWFAKWDKMDENQFSIANTFCLLAYGGGTQFITPKLKELYPELESKFEVEYWLLKEVKPNNN